MVKTLLILKSLLRMAVLVVSVVPSPWVPSPVPKNKKQKTPFSLAASVERILEAKFTRIFSTGEFMFKTSNLNLHAVPPLPSNEVPV